MQKSTTPMACYSEIWQQTAEFYADAFATANGLAISYIKAFTDIVWRPYPNSVMMPVLQGNSDRVTALLAMGTRGADDSVAMAANDVEAIERRVPSTHDAPVTAKPAAASGKGQPNGRRPVAKKSEKAKRGPARSVKTAGRRAK